MIKQEQLGFVKGNRTSDCLNILHSLTDYYLNTRRDKFYAAFIDLEKAYDKVPRDILLRKITRMGIRGNISDVIESMYLHEKTCIRIGHKRTYFFDVNIGVKQGCILSPILFNVFISDLPELFNKNEFGPAAIGNIKVGSLFWTDGIVILSESKKGLQYSLNQLDNYCLRNESKCC